jgi:hypothetical protein
MSLEPDAKRPRPAATEVEARPSSDPTPDLSEVKVPESKQEEPVAASSGLVMSPVSKPAEEPISFVVITNDGTDINLER